MIASLRGAVAARYADHVVLEVAGVGYRVFVSLTTLSALPEDGEPAHLHVHMIVREDLLQLYGFSTEEERETFRALIKVKDVGPKVARTILSVPASELAHAVETGNVAWLQRLPGVGKRIAERLTVELRGKLGAVSGLSAAAAVEAGAAGELTRALSSLGYRPTEIARVTKKLRPRLDAGEPLEVLLREAFKVVR